MSASKSEEVEEEGDGERVCSSGEEGDQEQISGVPLPGSCMTAACNEDAQKDARSAIHPTASVNFGGTLALVDIDTPDFYSNVTS
jgi:hypothetical protein